MYSPKWIVSIFLLLGLAACHPRMQALGETAAYKDVTVSEFADLMDRRKVVVLDVRTPKETAQGKITGAMELDVLQDDFAEKVEELNKQKTYLLYCRSGRRSLKAIDIMAKQGFRKIYNLQGGYTAWTADRE